MFKCHFLAPSFQNWGPSPHSLNYLGPPPAIKYEPPMTAYSVDTFMSKNVFKLFNQFLVILSLPKVIIKWLTCEPIQVFLVNFKNSSFASLA